MMQQMQKTWSINGEQHRGLQFHVDDSSIWWGPTEWLAGQQQGDAEPVSMKGGLCPKTAAVRNYDISAINVEITLNQWLDYYPGYMYALTENLEKDPGRRSQKCGGPRI